MGEAELGTSHIAKDLKITAMKWKCKSSPSLQETLSLPPIPKQMEVYEYLFTTSDI